MKTVNVVVIKKNAVSELFTYPDTVDGNSTAELKFLELMGACLTNFDEYTSEDVMNCLDDGIAKFGTGSICITHNLNTEEV